MGMSQEQAAATLHAAKMAQLNALGQNFDKLPAHLLPPHLADLSKMNRHSPDMNRMQSTGSVTIEPTKVPTSYATNDRHSIDIRRDEPMDLGLEGGVGQSTDLRNCRRDSDANNGRDQRSHGHSSGEDEYGSDYGGDREKN